MNLKDLIAFGVNPDKVEQIEMGATIDMNGNLCILQTAVFNSNLVFKINNSNGIYFKECDDSPIITDQRLVYLKRQIIRYCFKK